MFETFGLFKKNSIFFLISISLVSCVTIQDQHRNWLRQSTPVVFTPIISACYPLDASSIVDLKSDAVNLNELEVIWRSESARKFEFQVVSPVGQVLHEGSLNNGRVNIPEVLHGRVEVEKGGWINYDGYRLPLLDRELACFLGGYWPSFWMDDYFKDPLVSSNGRSVFFYGEDSYRKLELKISMVTSHGESKFEGCVDLTWGGVVGLFKRSMKICIDREADSFDAEIKGLNGITMRWRNGT